ncbi:hypothetical protein HYH03_002333 [Edaphochlamys debaryana]|uniref:Uncharacterized protein n=1 Tax=Edaphochlamys debaryana TaxID=47281 RepID=A0A835YCF2_9CHLO|nr:hypothetical protein HYH03_002333 [Edaphochlamys debaryana]|eukprot:KAG2500056.1 hypothetical protein HYH03_002333 [Edaphochlamys debaryana]
MPGAKRVASVSCASGWGASGASSASSGVSPCPVPVLGGGLAGGSLDVWLAVAAQVQDALAALPGWIQAAQVVQMDYAATPPSGAATPAELMQPAHGGNSSGRSSQFGFTSQRPGSAPFTSASSQAGNPGSGHSSTVAVPPLPPAGSDAMPAAPAPLVSDSAMDCSEPDATAFGWFSKCRGCRQMTAGEAELCGQCVPLCRTCSSTLSRKPAAERDQLVTRVMRTHAALCAREAGGGASLAPARLPRAPLAPRRAHLTVTGSWLRPNDL